MGRKPKPPEELDSVWDEEIEKDWCALNTKQQSFFIEWMTNGFNRTKAYITAYNVLDNENHAAVNGSNLLRHAKFEKIIQKLAVLRKSDFIEAHEVQRRAMSANKPVFKDGDMIMEIEDHDIRMKASMNILKAGGELVERKEVNMTVSLADQIRQAFDE
jgi:phage terminase small subunit